MRSAILGLMLVSAAATPAQAERFAISCKGKTQVGIGPAAGPLAGGEIDDKLIFVIDEDAKTVGSYDKKKRTLDDQCMAIVTCERSFSAERITIRANHSKDGSTTNLWFDWDRGTGKLDTGFEFHLTNGNVMVSRSTMKCVPAPMPALSA